MVRSKIWIKADNVVHHWRFKCITNDLSEPYFISSVTMGGTLMWGERRNRWSPLIWGETTVRLSDIPSRALLSTYYYDNINKLKWWETSCLERGLECFSSTGMLITRKKKNQPRSIRLDSWVTSIICLVADMSSVDSPLVKNVLKRLRWINHIHGDHKNQWGVFYRVKCQTTNLLSKSTSKTTESASLEGNGAESVFPQRR